MKRRIFAILLALMLAILPAMAEGAEGGFTPGEVRYAFEHNVLPRYFYEVPENMLDFLKESDMFTLWQSYATENGVDVTYSPEDYVTHTYTYDDNTTLVQVEMPQPEEMPQCYRVYLLYNPDTGELGYYTIERDDLFPDTCCVCMWTQALEHVSFGGAAVLDRSAADYADALKAEADAILSLRGAAPAAVTTTGEAAGEAEEAGETGAQSASEGPTPMGTFDYTDNILEDGTVIYYFQELSLSLPAAWQGKVFALQNDFGVSFYQLASYEKFQEEGLDGGGFLFRLGASVNQSFTELPSFEYLGFSEESCLNYYLELPSDYPAYMDDAIRAEYDQMLSQIDFVVQNASFYAGSNDVTSTDGGADLAVIPCPELGFSTAADPAYSWDYREGTGITIYTRTEGSIPYVIVYRNEDLLAEPFEFIREQYTPHVQQQYGDDLIEYREIEQYDIGGKQLPAGLYTYRLQGYEIDLLRLYDSTGSHTVSFTAKYVHGDGDATLAALDAAIRGYTEQ